MAQEWIKLHTKFLRNPVFLNDPTAWRVFEVCLGLAYPNGSFSIGIKQLEGFTGFKKSTIYDALKRLSNRTMIGLKPYATHTVVSILKWADYQTQTGLKPDSTRNETGLKPTLSNRLDIDKNKNISYISPLNFSDEVLEELKTKFPLKDVVGEIEKAKDWLKSNGKVKKDYLAFMRNWLRNSPDIRSRPAASKQDFVVATEPDLPDDPAYRARMRQKIAEGKAKLLEKIAVTN